LACAIIPTKSGEKKRGRGKEKEEKRKRPSFYSFTPRARGVVLMSYGIG